MTRRRLLRDRRGAELVEAAATLPLILALLLGIVEFGWDLYAWQAAQQAVRHGVRMGVVDQVHPSLTARQEALRACENIILPAAKGKPLRVFRT